MGNLPEVSDLPLDRLSTLHEEYNQFFKTGLEKKKILLLAAFQDSDREIKQRREELIRLVRGISY